LRRLLRVRPPLLVGDELRRPCGFDEIAVRRMPGFRQVRLQRYDPIG
jgi:hypothetical protein